MEKVPYASAGLGEGAADAGAVSEDSGPVVAVEQGRVVDETAAVGDEVGCVQEPASRGRSPTAGWDS
nr:hypothetical protein OG999_46620 [Streptomyces sp. NBC_00886]